jgi:hypothetical protein
MAPSISLYNHTTARFASGANSVGDTYKLMLCSAATFNAANTTLAGITKTEIASGTGYTTGGATLANVAVTTVTTNDAKFDADDISITASGGSIAASGAILYNDTDADDPPVAFLNFDGTITANDGIPFVVQWNANGILTFTTA